MSKSIRILFPDEIGQYDEKPAPDIKALNNEFAFKQNVFCNKSGYLQSIDGLGLMNIATGNDCVIVLHHRPGDFLVEGMVLCDILCHEECSDVIHKAIQDDFIIGKVRTPLQDAEYSIHQMVEVAARALSPGVNDPYTAIACIDNLTSVMCYLTGVNFPSPYRYDSQNSLRIIADNHTFSGMLNAAFNQIRQYGKGSPSVMIRLMEAMSTIASFVRIQDQQENIVQHAEMIMHASEKSFTEKRDLEDILERFKTLKEKFVQNG